MRNATLCLIVMVFAVPAAPLSAESPALSFADRVEAQRAIEGVYWRHRLWPKENPELKPALSQVMPDDVLRSKVEDYLKESAALESDWGRPVTAEQLQAELDRMARDTRDGAMLQELFHALGDDPFVIAETLARQTLVDRLIRNWHGDAEPFDAWWAETRAALSESSETPAASYTLPAAPQSSCVNDTWTAMHPETLKAQAQQTAVWTGSEMIVWGGAGVLFSGARYTPATDTWTAVSTGPNVPAKRGRHRAVWTGTKMVVWGGYNGSWLNTGGRYDPATDTWTPTSTTGSCPSGRADFTAVWTGFRWIVWGGNANGTKLQTGGVYNPATDTWTAMSLTNAPAARDLHTAVWTFETGMVIWGGSGNSSLEFSGGRYDLNSDTWTTISDTAAPSPRVEHTAVWTGTRMVVWGGSGTSAFNTGGVYNPVTDTWEATATGANCPAARYGHTAVWTDTEMIVWGGYTNATGARNDGGRYNPSTGVWSPMTSVNVPAVRDAHSAIWTGTEMIVWGGTDHFGAGYNTGGRYRPSTDSWIPTSTGVGLPAGRQGHTTVFTGTEMIVWGGANATYLNSGGRYTPATDSWTLTSSGTNVPSARLHHTAVWTGTEMIVWGGWRETGSSYENTGGRYNPATNSWTPTSTAAGCPAARQANTAVWTGTQMIVWGGTDNFSTGSNTGGRYTPATDSWTATSTGTNVPPGRFSHAAVWTGTQMIVWGGQTAGFLNTGGRYTPSTDTWLPTSTGANSPGGATTPTAVWTGTQMIVWGGFGSGGATNAGARYQPSNDSWTSIATTGAPLARGNHSAVWTGLEMLTWGGTNSGIYLDDGGRYSPSNDSWAPISTGTDHPAARMLHSAAWSGTEMIVWGGFNGASLQDGARYCGCASVTDYYRDADGDTFGSGSDVRSSCTGVVPAGYVANATDCDDTNNSIHPGGFEVIDGIDNNCPGDPGYGLVDEIGATVRFATAGDKTKLSWMAHLNASGYHVARSPYRDFHAGCRISQTSPAPNFTDTDSPAPGAIFYYLVRASGPWVGSWGQRSSGVERTVCHGCDSSTDQCDDGNPCSTDTCSGTTCVSGSAACDDGNPCTDDSCSPSQGCSHTFNANACDDGDACTSNDVCTAGVCAGTIPNLTNHLVISQIQVAGGTTDDEFIELYNPTAAPVVLSGLSLQYRTNAVSTWTVHVLGGGVANAVPAHGWLLVARTAYDGAVPADEITSLSLADSGGAQVILVNGTSALSACPPQTAVIDKVGWSSANCSEGSAAGLPSANNSILRKPGGACGNGVDTNSNTPDFVSQSPSTPRNSASAPQP